jgi:hypothetical protein
MFISWSVILSFGVLWARYARHLPDAIWFKVHRVTQYGGYVVAFSGFIVVLAGSKSKFGSAAHHVVGLLIMIFGLAQLVVAFFRPHKEQGSNLSAKRAMFEYFHWWNGRILVLGVVYQVISGIALLHPGFAGSGKALLAVYIVVLVIVLGIVLFLEIKNCRQIAVEGKKTTSKIVPCFKCYETYEIE